MIYMDQFNLDLGKNSVNFKCNNKQIIEYMERNQLQPTMVNIIKKSICLNCGDEYKNCDCLKYETKGEEIKDMLFIGCVLTRHRA